MTKRKQRDYLDALDSPSLTPDRFYALTLMAKVREVPTKDKALPKEDIKQQAFALAKSMKCVSCNKAVNKAKLYCGDYCQRVAQLVRYIRKAVADDRIKRKDIQEGIGISILMVIAGGYPVKERKLLEEQRQIIFKRDSYTCKICGKPATQIDHIKGNSDDPSNLNALCADCNRRKAFKNSRPATPEEKEFIKRMMDDMAVRIAIHWPLRLCDDYKNWQSLQGPMMGARKRRFNELAEEAENDFGDVDGYLRDAMEKDD